MAMTRILIIGGGAAGHFAAITAAEANPSARVLIHEATGHLLSKVRISGGGRCNVTHACFDPRALVKNYPRGGRELLGPFTRFGPRELVAWFTGRGVVLKTEADGRMFPASDHAATIIHCLQDAARQSGVQTMLSSGVRRLTKRADGRFDAIFPHEETGEPFDRVLIATGGTRNSGGLEMAATLGHRIVPPLPSLFTFNIRHALLQGLEGLSVPNATIGAPQTKFRTNGPLLITHWGLSGPAVLKLSAWSARELADCLYRFSVSIDWTGLGRAAVTEQLAHQRTESPRRQIHTANPFDLPTRLWERLLDHAKIARETQWANLSKKAADTLTAQCAECILPVEGKSTNKDEFVTCGGVALPEIDFRTMESRLCPGLHFAGEVLDIDGLTGGFNFQAAWTTGWHAGHAMAAA